MSSPFGKLPGGMGNMAAKLLQQARQAEASLANERLEGESGGGLVKAVVNGKGELLELTLAPELIDPNVEQIKILQDYIVLAVKEATTKANEHHEAKLKGVIPPGFGI